MIRRISLVALLLSAAACGGDGGGDDKPADDSGSPATSADAGAKNDAAAADAATPPKPDQVTNAGTACTNKSMCTGENPTCMKSVSVVVQSINFPGGYCSATCKSNVECGDNGECPVGETLSGAGGLGALGGAFDISSFLPSNCYLPCTADSECRQSEGYRCASILDALASGAGQAGGLGAFAGLLSGPIKDSKYCLPPAPPMPEAGMPTSDAGTGGSDAGTGSDAGAASDAGTGSDASTSDAASSDAATNDV